MMPVAARGHMTVGIGTMALVALATLALLAIAPATAWSQPRPTPRPGGVLNGVLPEDLAQGFAMHETATISTVWPSMPCFSNLVLFDPLKPIESVDTVIGELAERWSWQDNYRNLVFFLRRGVKWHDGQPFTARDVKYTFDMVREAPGTTARLRINPRKDWYANVDTIEVSDAHTVIFHLKRPQPSLLVMLASGYSPVYPAHIPAADFHTRCVGTGPFKLKEWRRGEFVEYVRNPDYFIPGRPYLDGINYTVITERGTRYAALQAGRVDIAFLEGPKALGPHRGARSRRGVHGSPPDRCGDARGIERLRRAAARHVRGGTTDPRIRPRGRAGGQPRAHAPR